MLEILTKLSYWFVFNLEYIYIFIYIVFIFKLKSVLQYIQQYKENKALHMH